MNQEQKSHPFFEELLLYSGQYTLFYIIMAIVLSPFAYITNTGHVALFFLIIIQTYILSKFSYNKVIRFFGNFIVPLGYSLAESIEGVQFVLNTGHIGFWLFALITAFVQLFADSKHKKISDVVLTITNIFSFIYVYIYLDVKMSLTNPTPEQLEIYNFPSQIPTFFADIAHVYIFIASMLLIVIIAYGRIKIINLQEYIKSAFGQYVDPSVRDKILQQHKPSKEFRAILFSDLRNFTSYSEKNTPQQVTKMLNAHFSLWSSAAQKHNGIIDKYIGDAVLIVFEKSQDAVDCAQSFSKLHAQTKPKLPLQFGVGIHCGDVILGEIGSATRKNYTVIGDTVNIAARLESLCKQKDVSIIVSDAVKEQITTKTRSLGFSALKGKKKPFLIHTLLN